MCAKKIRFDNHPQLPFEEWEWDMPMAEDRPKEPSAPQRPYSDLEVTSEDKVAFDRDDRNIYYLSMGSGSSGNCCYIGTKRGGVLIDAGVKTEEIVRMLSSAGIGIGAVKALLLTHDHSDHVRYAYNILRNHKHIRLFCTNRVINGVLRRHSISKRIKEYHHPIFKEIPFKICDFEITAFEVPHDGSDNMGFSIEYDDRHFVLATDLGAVTERARHYMSRANYLVIEANYDLQMLKYGRYPEYLKARIQTDNGHMDNEATGEFLKQIINPELEYIFLCHLSQDNNTPAKALRAVRTALESIGKIVGNGEETIFDRKADVQLMALPRYEATRRFVLRPKS